MVSKSTRTKKYKLPKWGELPFLLLSGKSGIALFPANFDDIEMGPCSKNVKIDHFAFNVTKENFGNTKKRYQKLNLKFKTQDHHYFDSIYTKDIDGHTVELTTIKVDERQFYK